jgi:Helix-turn-helix domain
MENVKSEQKKKDLFEGSRIYREQLLTVDDLNDFKRQLLFEIKSLLKEHVGQPSKKWLKSRDVRKMLNISPGTLQNLRVSGTLPYTRIGGVIYHDLEQIQKMLEPKKLESSFR